ncbi:MAG: MFS transporter [Chloroflexi bacterium]|nr:MFS transporter [Chloroflexota bacterium]
MARGGNQETGGLFYGWWLVVAGFFALGVTYGVWYVFSIFLVAVIEEFGWSRAAISSVFSLFVMVQGVSGPLVGAATDRFGPRKVIGAGGSLLVVSLLLCATIDSLWQFYLYYGILTGLGVSAAGWIPVAVLLGRWFVARLSIAMGAASTGIGAGILLILPFAQLLVSWIGWRGTFAVLALLALLALLPFVWLIRDRPESLGLRPDGQTVERARPGRELGDRRVVDREWVSRDWTIGRAIGTRQFWYLAVAFVGISFVIQMVLVHQVAHFVALGYDRLFAASISGLVGLSSMAGKVIWGAAADRQGRELAFAAGCFVCAIAIGFLLAIPGPEVLWLVPIYGVLIGVGYAVSAPLPPAAVADLFAGRNYGVIFGTLYLGTSIGGAAGPALAGWIFDVTQSYQLAFITTLVALGIATLAFWLAAPRRVRLAPGRVRPLRDEEERALEARS